DATVITSFLNLPQSPAASTLIIQHSISFVNRNHNFFWDYFKLFCNKMWFCVVFGSESTFFLGFSAICQKKKSASSMYAKKQGIGAFHDSDS
ncbi:MAG: hypothetical protein II369_06245, partial [Clostridia bacterium]|nr:hypothetical protein [Clostridia bacterium]